VFKYFIPRPGSKKVQFGTGRNITTSAPWVNRIIQERSKKSISRGAANYPQIKGGNPLTEHYSIFKALLSNEDLKTTTVREVTKTQTLETKITNRLHWFLAQHGLKNKISCINIG
jgi:hypothetical protein